MTADFDTQRIYLAHESDFSLSGIDVRPATRQVEVGGVSETLEPRIMQVLVVLARRRGQVVSRDDLIAACWEGRIVGDDALNRCISKIRRLGETHGAFRLETIPRVGYRMHVAEALEAHTANAEVAAEAAPVAPKAARLPIRAIILAGAGVLLAVLVALVAYVGVRNSRTVDVAAATMIALRQFEAPDGDVDSQNLARAVPAAIAEDLTGVGMSVKTVSRSEGADTASIGASYLVDGSVVKSGDVARVFVRVDHIATGVTILSTALEGEAGDVGLFADRLSTDVARYLSWQGSLRILRSRDPAEIAIAPVFVNSLRLLGEGDYLGALALARRALQMAPNSSDANIAVAIQGMQAMGLTDPADRPALWREAIAAADRAWQLDPRHGSTHLAKMWTLPTALWAERIELLRTGVAMDVENGSTYGFLNALYLSTGQLEKARIALAQGRARDPLDTGKMFRQAQTFIVMGDFDAARAAFAELDRRAGPDFPRAYDLLIPTSVWWMSPEEARAVRLKPLPPLSRVSTEHVALLGAIADALAEAKIGGDERAAERIWKACTSEPVDKSMRLTCLSAGAQLGRLDIAFAAAGSLLPDVRATLSDPQDEAWLATPTATQDALFLFTPWTASLRADERIIPVFERLGILEYWRETGAWPDFCETEPDSVCSQMKTTQPRSPQ
jgi:DNA-binding winged helix-turn-helix (wHTH) protein/tetratricopeptide (TPR) repeat protein